MKYNSNLYERASISMNYNWKSLLVIQENMNFSDVQMIGCCKFLNIDFFSLDRQLDKSLSFRS